MEKKLYKSANDKMLSGVMGGFAEYFKLDSTLVRLVYSLITIVTGIFPCILFYIICAIVMPEPPFSVE